MDIWNYFLEKIYAFDNKIALSTSSVSLTFAELLSSAEHLAESFSKHFRRGDLVVVLLPNSLEFIPVVLALWKINVSVALASAKCGSSEIQAVYKQLQPNGILTNASLESIATVGSPQRVLIELTKINCTTILLVSRQSATAREPFGVIKLTSGSTGEPKAVALSSENIVAESMHVCNTLSLSSHDRIYCSVPISHSYGFDLGVLGMLGSGATLLLRDQFIPRQTLTEIVSQKVTVFLGVPSMYYAFTQTRLSTTPDLSHVRYLLSCTAPLSSELIRHFHERFLVSICQHYGSSESGAVANHVPERVLEKIDSVGLPMHNVQVKIVDENGVELGVGQEGEIIVSSKVIAQGYLMGAPAEKSPFVGRDFHMGDRGFFDADGFLYLRGRLDKIINVGGFKVSPSEVVDTLKTFPPIADAIVVGAPDPMGGQVVCAFVILRSPTTENEILDFCRGKLADYKVPRNIEFRREKLS